MKKNLMKTIGYIVMILFLVWIMASFINTNANNLNGGEVAWWNLFKLLFGK